MTPTVDAVRAAYARIAAADRPEVWITLRRRGRRARRGRGASTPARRGELPLAGLRSAVKDNIDVAGLPTTAGCPAFAYAPGRRRARRGSGWSTPAPSCSARPTSTSSPPAWSAPAVPYGAVRDARAPGPYVSGGSSSGSAVAVALGIADLALGTDTAGSGRVPAAFSGIVGIKPTRGLVPTDGVVPACRTLDCVTIFARDLAAGRAALALMAGADARDPLRARGPPTRRWPRRRRPRVAVPDAARARRR